MKRMTVEQFFTATGNRNAINNSVSNNFDCGQAFFTEYQNEFLGLSKDSFVWKTDGYRCRVRPVILDSDKRNRFGDRARGVYTDVFQKIAYDTVDSKWLREYVNYLVATLEYGEVVVVGLMYYDTKYLYIGVAKMLSWFDCVELLVSLSKTFNEQDEGCVFGFNAKNTSLECFYTNGVYRERGFLDVVTNHRECV